MTCRRVPITLLTVLLSLPWAAPAQPSLGSVEVNVSHWPPGPDLCRAPWMEDVCAADRTLRRRLGLNEELQLHPRLRSLLVDDGVVWAWTGPAPDGPVSFDLLDGTRVRLHLPAEDPPAAVEPAGSWTARVDPAVLGTAGAVLGLCAVGLLVRRRRDRQPYAEILPDDAFEVDPPDETEGEPFLDLEVVELEIPGSPAALLGPGEAEAVAVSPVTVSPVTVSPVAVSPVRASLGLAPTSPCEVLRAEIAVLPEDERRGLERSLAAAARLADWSRCLLSVTAAQAVLAEALPAPSRQEWLGARSVLERFLDRHSELLAGLAEQRPPSPASEALMRRAGLLDPARPLRQRFRRLLLTRGGVPAVALAVQYLVEAFPVEHLSPAERQGLRQRLRDELRAAGLTPRFHDLVGEVAAGLGLVYREVRYYRTRLGDPGAEEVGDAWGRLALDQRLGFAAATDEGAVVRLGEPFLFERANGARVSGMAWIAA